MASALLSQKLCLRLDMEIYDYKSRRKVHGFNRGMKAKKLFAIIGQ